MLSLHRSHGRRDRGRCDDLSRDGRSPSDIASGADSPPFEQAAPDAVPVLLSPGLVELALPLTKALGPEFCVLTDGQVATGVMIVGPLGPVGIAFLRASHPDVVLLVVDRRWSSAQPNEAVTHLEAGADGYLASPPIAEISSHIRAMARRAAVGPGRPWPPPSSAPSLPAA